MSGTLSTIEAIAILKDRWSELQPSDYDFAQSLLGAAEAGKLTDGRVKWVVILANRIANPRPAPMALGDLTGVLELFDTAMQHLKTPSIVLSGDDGVEIRLSIAGERAKVPGSVTVAEVAPYGQGRWFGRILRNGTLEHGRDSTPAWLAPLLKRFAAEPARVAAEHGHAAGRCCFCNLKLKDKRSVAAGYGKTCAEHYGLASQWKSAARDGGVLMRGDAKPDMREAA